MSSKNDKFYLKLALNLAKQNEGLTNENPSVGCVIVKDNKILSLSKTSISGRPHAEDNAIRFANTNDLKGSTIYVTLEPCTHHGKTPPCTDLIIKKKISKIVYASNDIDERTANKLKKVLKNHNISTKQIRMKEITDFYKSYFFIRKNKFPYITAKLACSNDYYIYSKKNKNITNELSRKTSHLLRYKNNAILISSKTLNKDNPFLNCRIEGLENYSPTKIILDKNLNYKKNLNIFKDNIKKCIFFYNRSNKKKLSVLKKNKIKYYKVNLDSQNNLDFTEVKKKLFKLNINYLLVEGGKELTKSLIQKKHINQFFLFKSGKKLNKNGQLKIKEIVNQLNKKFKNKKNLDIHLNEDRVIYYS